YSRSSRDPRCLFQRVYQSIPAVYLAIIVDILRASLYRFSPQAQVGLSSKSSLASNIADWYSTGNVAVKKGRRRGRMLATCGLREPSQFRSPIPYCYTQPTLPLLASIALYVLPG